MQGLGRWINELSTFFSAVWSSQQKLTTRLDTAEAPAEWGTDVELNIVSIFCYF
jgi:hypothetical protein